MPSTLEEQIIDLLNADHMVGQALTVRAIATYLGVYRGDMGFVSAALRNLSRERGSGVRYLGRSADPNARYTNMYTGARKYNA